MDTALPAGRYAPSPTGDLHIGNLRTALLAWLFARSTGRRFLLRMEDLDDRVRPESAVRQLADLKALGLDWDGDVIHQSDRRQHYEEAVGELAARGLTYECYCSRREIHAAASAPHAAPGAYPGTCRDLSAADRAARRGSGRPAAVRLRSSVSEYTITDEFHGRFSGVVDDFVLRRGDGTPAYNLAVVLDDAATGVDQVVRGDDLLTSAPRQSYLASLLRIPAPHYVHVPLVLGPHRKRLAKRDGAITLSELTKKPTEVVGMLAQSLALSEAHEMTPSGLLQSFDPARIQRRPWVFHPRKH
ncbi:tRNA glutamyl-Q(34) synthetase GluQRS [Hoyosella sp. YIM 151337]|uniref:tRNA glutamyl-Q(34) synthetase GluQRS n=1 Tax=Hoyosella sp. YIM 151337 TaxID=2992742 RepID=UPI0022363F28|nr:tRNA glutamyl-Q(34) synthetase GluQRS [Hoyosella sp. YIM 151337]MCW4352664.1 tRNA glutamyl-Q(34) synthetase GluQRS [Hoyosella sp. YIM 151337]